MEKLPQTVNEFDRLMALEKIEHRHLGALSADEKAAFMDRLYNKLAKLEGRARDTLVEKTLAILDKDFIWEHNHTKINTVIKLHVREFGFVPNKAAIAAECGLSRKTVHEHLREIDSSEAWADQKGAEKILNQNIMGTVIKAALRGDLKAAKLYIEATKAPKGGEATINNHNNYIQINKTVINQQVIQQLKPEQLKLIEQIITGNEGKNE